MSTPMIIIKSLLHGRSWLWYADLQILALSDTLDAAGRKAAVDEFIAQSRQFLVTQLDRPAV